jgi:hypothetical protein
MVTLKFPAVDAVSAGIGAGVAILVSRWLERRALERKTLTAAEQQWMASTHAEGATDG